MRRDSFLISLAVFALAACGGGAQQSPPQASGYPPPRAGTVIGYRLPVNGTWRVQNTHYGNKRDQAYAIDIVVPARNRRYYEGDGRQNSDWPAYGQPVVADAPGVVVIAVDGVPENEPRDVNAYDMHGNYVVIDHQNGEFSLMAHLIPARSRCALASRSTRAWRSVAVATRGTRRTRTCTGR